MHNLTRRGAGIIAAALATVFLISPGHAASTEVPAPGQSPKIDAIKERGSLRVAAIGEFPWLPENTTGSGPQFSGPAWVLAEEYAKRLEVPLEVVPVSHETKVPILATGDADISIAPLAVTPQRLEVVNFVVYSRSSLCFFGLASNPKLQDVKTVDDLNREDLTMAYFTGTPPEAWAPTRFPKVEVPGGRRLGRQRAGRGGDVEASRLRLDRQCRVAAPRPTGAGPGCLPGRRRLPAEQ